MGTDEQWVQRNDSNMLTIIQAFCYYLLFLNSIRDGGKKANKRNIKWKPKSYNDLDLRMFHYKIGYNKSASLILALDTCSFHFLCLFSIKPSIKGCTTHLLLTTTAYFF